MQVARVTARAGRAWVFSGFALMRRAPIAMMMVTLSYLLVLLIVSAFPFVGPLLSLVLTPVLSVGMMHAVRTIAEQRTPTPKLLLQGFRDQDGRAWRPLIALGVLNASSFVLATGAATLADGGVLFEMFTGRLNPDDPRLTQAPLLLSMLLFGAVYTPIQMALWYSPLFCAWHNLSAGKALFFSLVAVLRNKWAFLQYGITWLLVALAASVVMLVLRTMLPPVLLSLANSLTSILMLSALYISFLYCSIWPSYREVVVDGGQPAGTPAAPL